MNVLLIDGTRLYLSTREIMRPGTKVDYEKIKQVLLKEAKISAFDRAIYFTTSDVGNEGQQKFLRYLSSKIGWTVEASHVAEVDPVRMGSVSADSKPWIRFDPQIAFALGKVCKKGNNIFVVSDSYTLKEPIEAACEYESNVTLAFFGSMLDSRWFKEIRNPIEGFSFFDLDAAISTEESEASEIKRTFALADLED